MENSTATFSYEWEYYYDYIDPVIVDESKLKYNKYSIVILFWIFLAAFVGFLFLFLNLMSRSSNPLSSTHFLKKRLLWRTPPLLFHRHHSTIFK
uniref:Melanocortin 2 receptor accessory protein n=1 Tax=Cynoglossus semilaevis TaxID=244447 RepID=A0A3P8W377_CYNSE